MQKASSTPTIATNGTFELRQARYMVSTLGPISPVVYQAFWANQALAAQRTLSNPSYYGLATVFTPLTSNASITTSSLKDQVDNFKHSDDVFDEAFLSILVFPTQYKCQCMVSEEVRRFTVSNYGTEAIVFTHLTPLPGPYLLAGNQLLDVWKVVDDFSKTCMSTFEPQLSRQESFRHHRLTSDGGTGLTFALRSRIKTRHMTSSPISGMRIVVKDNIDVWGIKTSNGSKAFYDLYRPREASAACIQRLVDRGVVIAGKTKMTSFANWEEPAECIDFEPPWNPRGDGFQSPGGSSSGSAAAIASYEWLDIAIGTDTWASITRPSLWCGCFGLRPTKGAVSISGIEPSCQLWDTPGILARDLRKCRVLAAEWLEFDMSQNAPKQFSSVLWPSDFWEDINPSQATVAYRFAQSIGVHLNIVVKELSFRGVWEESPPMEAGGLTLSEFIDDAPGVEVYDTYQYYRKFLEEYYDTFGKVPSFSKRTEEMWNTARGLSREIRDERFRRIQVYKDWFMKSFFANGRSNSLLVLPIESMTPRPRDQLPQFKRPPSQGISALGLGPVMDSPVLAIPISEVPFHSRVTGRVQKMPLVIALMSDRGTDMSLIDIALETLESMNLPTVVGTGSVLHHKKSNSPNRDFLPRL